MAKASSSSSGNKSSAASSGSKGIMGGYTGLRDMFDGGGPGKSSAAAGASAAKGGAPTTSARPQARPDVVKVGSGKDTQYMDTRTGKSYAAPSYGQFSWQGLTSTDPANVARNRYGAERLAQMDAMRGERRGSDPRTGGIASLAPGATTTPTPTPAPAPTPAELAALGAPTTEMAPIFVEPPVYGIPGAIPGQGQGYGAAFTGPAPMLPINLMDIFAAYPTFGMR